MTLQELKNAAKNAAENYNELNIKVSDIIKVLKQAKIVAYTETKELGKGLRLSKSYKETRLIIELNGKKYNENCKNQIFIARFLAENL